MRKSSIVADDRQNERDALTGIWKKRDAQLARMTTLMLSMAGDLQESGPRAVGRLENLAMLPGLGVREFESA